MTFEDLPLIAIILLGIAVLIQTTIGARQAQRIHALEMLSLDVGADCVGTTSKFTPISEDELRGLRIDQAACDLQARQRISAWIQVNMNRVLCNEPDDAAAIEKIAFCIRNNCEYVPGQDRPAA